MTWFKVDDKLAFHPKVLAAGNTAMGLWVRAGAWASDQLTDGHIPGEVAALLSQSRSRDAAKLVQSGLWIAERNGGFTFHDWTDLNPLRSDVLDARDNRSMSAQLANHNRWHALRATYDPNCKFCADHPTR